jgi:predicted small secreted protein
MWRAKMKRFQAIKIVLVLAMLLILMACEQTNGIGETVNNGDKPGSNLPSAVIPINEISETVNNGNKPGSDIASAVIPTYAISGTVSGDHKEGITITLSGDASSIITTPGDGTYTFTGLAKGSYTVTPTLTDSTFSPASTPVKIVVVNVEKVDFLSICKDEDNDGMCD